MPQKSASSRKARKTTASGQRDSARKSVKEKKLNARQELFANEYLVDLNATQAAIRAGYSPKTAGQQGFELLKKPEIQAAIKTAQAERIERTKIDADWVVKRLVCEADADLADLYDEDGQIRPIKQWPMVWRRGLVSGIETAELTAEGAKIADIQKVKLSERIKRLEMIGRHLGMFSEADKAEDPFKVFAELLFQAAGRPMPLAEPTTPALMQQATARPQRPQRPIEDAKVIEREEVEP